MRLYGIILIIALFNFTRSYSQTHLESLIDKNEFDIYSKLLDKEFSHVLTGKNTESGSVASLSTESDIATFSGHFRLGKRSNINITAKGGVTEGIIPLISGGKTSSNISVGLRYNLGIYKHINNIYVDATKFEQFRMKEHELIALNSKKIAEIRIRKEKLELDLLNKTLELDKKTISLKEANASTAPKNPDPIKYKYLQDSIISKRKQLEYDIAVINNELDLLKYDLANFKESDTSILMQVADEAMSEEYKKEWMKLNLIGYNLKWWSFGINLNNRSFKSFADSLSFDDQITKNNFNNVEILIARNRYNLNPDKRLCTFYQSYGLKLSYEDNFDELTKTEVADLDTISLTPTLRTVTSKQTVYTGEYNRDNVYYTFFYDLYWFLNQNQTLAIHINPTFKDNSNRKDEKFNLLTGIMVGFQDKEDDKNIINLELFFKMKNLFGKYDEGESFSDRTNLGLSLNFPINLRRKN